LPTGEVTINASATSTDPWIVELEEACPQAVGERAERVPRLDPLLLPLESVEPTYLRWLLAETAQAITP